MWLLTTFHLVRNVLVLAYLQRY
ncbi:unnamed protein product [Timema podura]|uniref:Uncharacterized protein n=1 Tax=Timema podura TaxID=61482 RepID=A0ABN7P0B7_TIMPD|nr:unnamed protein product [Timema podura]